MSVGEVWFVLGALREGAFVLLVGYDDGRRDDAVLVRSVVLSGEKSSDVWCRGVGPGDEWSFGRGYLRRRGERVA